LKNKTDLIIGFFLGIITSMVGCFLFISIFTSFSFVEGMQILRSEGKLGKIITIGTVLDLIVFWTLLKYYKEFIARGVILAVIALTIFTLFV
jgi:hypothetical protein